MAQCSKKKHIVRYLRTYDVETRVVGLARLALVLANARGGGGDRGGSLVRCGISTLEDKAVQERASGIQREF